MNDASVTDFDSVYRAHVDMVVSGDLKGVMADMDPASLPTVFNGVDVPRGVVDSAEIVRTSVEDQRAVGEAIYRIQDGAIGLRSGWTLTDGRWLADHLENFEPSAAQ